MNENSNINTYNIHTIEVFTNMEVIVRILILILAMMCFLPGCGNLSPRQEQRINNQDGKIGEVDTLANSLKAEIGNLKAQNEMLNNKIGQMQQGLVNLQSNSENSGVQILSGPGGLIFSIIALLTLTTLTFHYRGMAAVQKKSSEILAQTIVAHNDNVLEDKVFQAAMYTNAESNILGLIKKQKSLLR
jgi:cell division protein FtsB